MIDRACISLGEKCNLKCRYCHFEDRLTNNVQEFSIENLYELTDNIYEYVRENCIKQFKIGIVGSGEPILEFSKIKTLILYIKEKEMKELSLYTITNGTVLNHRIAKFFYDNKDFINLCFSLDGPEHVHNYGREKFSKVISGITLYEDIFGNKPVINCTVHKNTFDNRRDVFDFFETNNFKHVTFSKLVDRDNSPYYITDHEYANFIEDSKNYSFQVRQLKNDKKKYDCTMYGQLCAVGRNNPFLTKVGIFPCGRFYGNSKYNYGSSNIKLKTIEEKMSKMQALKDGECYYNKYIQGER